MPRPNHEASATAAQAGSVCAGLAARCAEFRFALRVGRAGTTAFLDAKIGAAGFDACIAQALSRARDRLALRAIAAVRHGATAAVAEARRAIGIDAAGVTFRAMVRARTGGQGERDHRHECRHTDAAQVHLQAVASLPGPP